MQWDIVSSTFNISYLRSLWGVHLLILTNSGINITHTHKNEQYSNGKFIIKKIKHIRPFNFYCRTHKAYNTCTQLNELS